MTESVVLAWPKIRRRVLRSPAMGSFIELPHVDWKPGLRLCDIAPPGLGNLALQGIEVWAVIDGRKVGIEEWFDELPPQEKVVSFKYLPGDPITVSIVLFVVSTIIQLVVAHQNKPGRPPSPTYSFGPIQTLSAIGTAIPVTYGRHLVGGVLIGRYATIDGSGDPVLNSLVLLCEGPIASVAGLNLDQDNLTGGSIPNGILINGTEANVMPGVEVSVRLGTPDQLPIPGFAEPVTGYAVNTVVNQNYPVTYRTNGQVESLEVLLTFPNGLYYQGKKLHSKTLFYSIRRQKLSAQGAAIDPTAWTLDAQLVTKKLTTPFTISRKYGPIEKGYYAIEVKRDWIDDDAAAAAGQPGHVSTFLLDSVNEGLLSGAVSYTNRALIAIKNLATAQFQTGSPNFNILIEGKLHYVWNGVDLDDPDFFLIYNRNPAWIILDMLTNKRYGCGEDFTLSNFFLDELKEYADFCDEMIDIGDGLGTLGKRFEINFVFDTQDAVWDQCLKIAAATRASMVKIGVKVRIKIDREEAAVQVFSAGNILRDTFRHSDTGTVDKKNFIEAQFLNEDNDFAQDTAPIYDPDLNTIPKRDNQTLYGLTKAYQAYRQAQYIFNANKLRVVTEFEVPLDSLASEPGDKVLVQNDIIDPLRQGGRVLSATASGVTLDRDVPITPGSTPRITVRTSAPVATWAASTFTWGSAFGLGRSWLGAYGQETLQTRIVSQQASASSWSAATFTWGSATGIATHWGTLPAGSALTLTTPWDAGDIPQKHDVYIFDRNSGTSPVGDKYRILEVSRTQRLTAKLRCIEFTPDTYQDDPGPMNQINGSDPANPGKMPPDVTGLNLFEMVGVNTDGSVVPTIQVSWQKPNFSLPYKNVIYIRPDNIPFVAAGFTVVGETDGQSFTIPDTFFDPGFTYTIAVTSKSIAGTEKSPNAAPQDDITPTGIAASPADVTGFSAIQSGVSINFSWTAIVASDLDGYEIRYGPSWSSGITIGTSIQGNTFSTTTWVPGLNQYWIKAKNTTGAYSLNATGASVNAVAVGLVALDEQEATDWLGTKTNFTLSFPNLISDQGGMAWSAATFTWGSAQGLTTIWKGFAAEYETPIYRPESWESQGLDTWAAATYAWDQGHYGSYQISIIPDVVGIDVTKTWADCDFPWSDPIATQSDWIGLLTGDVNPITLGTEISISPDGTSFGAFAAFSPGIYAAQAFKVNISASANQPQYRAKLRGLRTVATT